MISRIKSQLKTRTGIALYTRKPSQVDRFIVHHGASKTPTTAAEELSTLRGYDNYHYSKGWGGIGYNLAVGPVTGNVYEARGLDRVGAHATGQNTRSVGVVVLGNDPLTAKAKEGLKKAYQIANGWAGKTLTPSGHRDHASTNCPGPKVYQWLKSGGLSTPAPTTPTTPTKPVKQTLVVDGYWGPATTRALQQINRTPIDGVVSSQPTSNKHLLGGVSGWEFSSRPKGSLLIRKMQKAFKVSQDGFFGPQSIRGMQRYYKTPVDGVISGGGQSSAVRAMQRAINRQLSR